MNEPDALHPADPDDLESALAFALRWRGRKRTHDADDAMASIVAKRLADHLRESGFVIMKRPPTRGWGPALMGKRPDDN